MTHPWIKSGKSAQDYDLQTSQQKIKKYLANRRFRKVAFAVIAVNRAKSSLSKLKKLRQTQVEAAGKRPLEETEEKPTEVPVVTESNVEPVL